MGFKVGNMVRCVVHKDLKDTEKIFTITNIRKAPNGNIILEGTNTEGNPVEYSEEYCKPYSLTTTPQAGGTRRRTRRQRPRTGRKNRPLHKGAAE
jgi:hypothetical protein